MPYTPRAVRFLIVIIAFTLLLSASGTYLLRQARAQQDAPTSPQMNPGDLDTTFDTDGKVTTDFEVRSDLANAVTQQTDGKIVAVGYMTRSSNNFRAFAVTRYNTDGSLDTTFGTGGKVVTDFDTPTLFNAEAQEVVLQPDGKIVVVGYATITGTGFLTLARYLPNGQLDTTFDSDGKVSTRFDNLNCLGYALALLPDGNILTAGYQQVGGSNDDFLLARYKPDGSPDTSFGTGGRVTTDFTGSDRAFDMVMQADGKVILGGQRNTNLLGLARYNADGALDISFGAGGRIAENLSPVRAMTLQTDGKLLAVNFSMLARYQLNGAPDSAFGINGKVNVSDSSSANSAVSVVAGNRIAVGGGNFNGFELDMFTGSGARDLTFGSSGRVVTPFTNSGATINDLLAQADSKIVAVGSSASVGSTTSDVALARYFAPGSCDYAITPNRQALPAGGGPGATINVVAPAGCAWTAVSNSGFLSLTSGFTGNGNGTVTFTASANTGTTTRTGTLTIAGKTFNLAQLGQGTSVNGAGVLDLSFDFDGFVLTDINGNAEEGNAAALQPDGKIVVAGTAQGGVTAPFVLRYLPDGALDTGFGNNGRVVLDLGTVYGTGLALALQPDGKMLLAGASGPNTNNTATDFVMARILPNGSLDTGFGTGGKVFTDFNNGTDVANTLALQSDGKIILGGGTLSGAAGDFALARYNQDGVLDATFGNGGKVTIDFAATNEEIRSVSAVNDGKILVAGRATNNSSGTTNTALLRLQANGAPDTAFGAAGRVLTTGGEARDMLVQPDGKIAVLCENRALFRYLPDGALDGSFGLNGKALVVPTISSGSTPSFSATFSLARQDDGKIMVGGSCFSDFCAARILSDGSTDPSFGLNGIAVGDGGLNETGHDILLLPDGKVLVVGSRNDGSGGLPTALNDVALARFLNGANCTYSVQPNSFAFPAAGGGSGTASIAAPAGCAWSANANNATFINFTSVTNGSGNGVVNFTANSANPNFSDRSGGLNIAGQFVPVRQLGTGVTATGPGSHDLSFDFDGLVNTNFFGASGDFASATLAQPDGKIIIAGSSENGFGAEFALARYNPDGSLDTGFGVGGKVVTELTPNYDNISSLALQSDGKIIAGGVASSGTQFNTRTDFAVVRYLPNGALDTTFGNGGRVITNINNANSRCLGVAVQPDDKVVATGTVLINSSNSDIVVARYNTDGTTDMSFSGGRVLTDFNNGSDQGNTVLVLPNGKIIVAGRAALAPNSSVGLGLVGYNSNGTLDNSFGNNGKAFAGGSPANDLALLPDGKLFIVGGNGAFRFHPNGALDNSFGLGGRTRLNFSSSNGPTSFEIQPDSKILVAGSSSNTMQLMRLLPDGAPDTGFGVNALASFLNANSVTTTGVILQADGRILLAGSAFLNTGTDFILVRANGGATCNYSISPSGQLFSRNGGTGTIIVFTQTGCPWTAAVSATTTPAFITLASATSGNGSGTVTYTVPPQASFALPRSGIFTVAGRTYLVEQRGANQAITSDPAPGFLDETFDNEGEVLTNFIGNSTEEAWDLAIQSDGRLVAVGWADYGFGRDFAVVRYNSDGSLDSAFGNGGRVITDFGGGDEAYAVDLQADGKIVVAGVTNASGPKDWVVARYNADGTLDTGFGLDGRVIVDMGPISGAGSGDNAQAMVIQSDGKIVLVGNAYRTNDFNGSDFALARLNFDGTLDTTFGNNGKVLTDFNGQADFGNSALLQGDGKIVVAGTAGFTDFGVARYDSNGSLDTTFGINGRVITNVSGDDNAFGIASQEDGKLVVAGNSGGLNSGNFAAVRYTANGVLDSAFGTGGVVNLSFSGLGSSRAYSVVVLSNGQIVLGGFAGQASFNRHFAFVRLNTNGTVDRPFNLFIDGPVMAFALSPSECRALALQSDGKVVAAGAYGLDFNTLSDFALARIYTNPPGTLTLAGRFTDSNNMPVRGLPVLLSGTTSRTTTTDTNGVYTFDQLRSGGDYVVKSTSASYVFAPFRRDFANLTSSLTNVNFTADAAVLPPVITPVLDDFNGPRDSNKWSVGVLTRALNSSNNGVASVSQNNQLVITPRPNVPDANHNGYVGVNNFDFTNGAASVELVQAANGGGETGFAVGTGPEFYFRFAVLPFNANPSQPEGQAPAAESPLLVMQVRNSGQFKLLSVPYNPTAHRFLRLRHVPETIPPPASNASPGGYVVFEASPAANPINYTELFRITIGPRSVAQMSVELSAGTSNPINTPGQAIFDNFAATSNSSAQFMTSSFTASEAAGQVAVTVTRSGDTSNGASVEYATAGGTAQSGSRYIYTSGTLIFAPNETSKNFSVPLIDNVLVDGTQTVEVLLSNARSAALNSPARAIVTITDNDTPGVTNSIEDAQFFVRQQYFDFLNRVPDAAGLDYWTGQITTCGADAACIRSRRISVSAAFFVELEFQETGYVVYRFYRAAFGSMTPPDQTRANLVFNEFTRDRSQIIAGPMLEQSTREFAERFIQREQFTAAYPLTMTNAQFVNKLFDTANLTPFATERQAEIDALNNTGRSRAQVLFNVINLPAFRTREYNPSFVLMQYFGYLRRDPDQGGYDFWLNILNQQPQNFRGMVCAFLTSAEYQLRFGTQTPRSNQECGPGV